MGTQIIRLGNGETIQVRTGVLRGAGPAGPPGPSNDLSIGTVVVGDTADATISGTSPNQVLNLVLPKSTVPGPTGSIADYVTKVATTSNITVNANTDTAMTFGTVTTDELNMIVNTSTFRPVPSGGVPMVLSMQVEVTIDNNGVTAAGYRSAWVLSSTGELIAENRGAANPLSTGKTVLPLFVVHRFAAGETFTVIARHGSGGPLPCSARLKAIRVGAGPTGPAGPAGPSAALTVGTVTTLATGVPATATITGSSPNQVLNLGLPMGATGPSGNAGSGYAAIHELDGTGGNTA